jgi:endonuclease YncB( thermonuclease family)
MIAAKACRATDVRKALSRYLVIGLILSTCGPAGATGAEIVGPARAKDGDSLIIGKVEIRLYGMDAFEYSQTCGRFACGRAAANRLHRLVAKQTIHCRRKDTDAYGRTVAQCFDEGGHDLGQQMVAAGLAVAYRRHSKLYVVDEARARKRKTGAWAYPFQSPEVYRHKN